MAKIVKSTSSFNPVTDPQWTDAFGGEVENGLYHEGENAINSASEMSNGWIDNLLDPTGFVKGFYNDMMGFTSQSVANEHEEYMTDKQNKWNSAQEQMKRAKEAGINPLTAAGAIAGGNSSAAPSGASASPSTALADTISSLGSLHANTDLSAAEAENQRSQAANNSANLPWIGRLNHAKFMEGAGNFMKSLTEAGNEEITAGGIAFDIMSGGLKAAVDYLALYNGLRYKDQEFKNIKANYELTMKEVERFDDRINSQISLQAKQGLLAEKQALKAQAETTYQNQLNKICSDLPGIQLPGANGMIYSYFKFGPDSDQFKAFGKGLFDWNYQSSLGGFTADFETLYKRKLNEFKAKADVDSEFKPYLDFLEELHQAELLILQSDLEDPKTWDALFGKLFKFNAINVLHRNNVLNRNKKFHKPSSGPVR